MFTQTSPHRRKQTSRHDQFTMRMTRAGAIGKPITLSDFPEKLFACHDFSQKWFFAFRLFFKKAPFVKLLSFFSRLRRDAVRIRRPAAGKGHADSSAHEVRPGRML